MWPDANIGVVKADRDEVAAQVVIASVQTLARPKRLAHLIGETVDGYLPAGPFGLVVVDEAHHTAADTYRAILDALQAGTPHGPVLLGVTATPQRGDRVRLDDVFNEVVFEYPMLWGMQAGFLCDMKGLRISTDLDLSKVKTSHGDYNAGSAGEAMEAADVPDRIAQAYVEHATGRHALAFTPTVETAEQTRDALRRRGVRAEMVWGAMDLDDRRRVLRDYELGTIDVVSNCMVLTEGFDDPRTDCIIVGRPTKSQSLYVQMVGRGTRRHPDKDDCLVLDVVGVSDSMTLVTLASLFGVDKEDVETVGVLEAQEKELARLAAAGAITAKEVDLFRQMRRQQIAWVLASENPKTYLRSVTRSDKSREWVVIKRLPEGDWGVKVTREKAGVRILARNVELEFAQGIAEDYVRQHSGVAAFHRADAAWRLRPPTDKALWAAKKWKLRVDPTWNAGQLSDAMDAQIARRTKVV